MHVTSSKAHSDWRMLPDAEGCVWGRWWVGLQERKGSWRQELLFTEHLPWALQASPRTLPLTVTQVVGVFIAMLQMRKRTLRRLANLPA